MRSNVLYILQTTYAHSLDLDSAMLGLTTPKTALLNTSTTSSVCITKARSLLLLLYLSTLKLNTFFYVSSREHALKLSNKNSSAKLNPSRKKVAKLQTCWQTVPLSVLVSFNNHKKIRRSHEMQWSGNRLERYWTVGWVDAESLY